MLQYFITGLTYLFFTVTLGSILYIFVDFIFDITKSITNKKKR